MAIKFLSITLFFSVVIINPVHNRFPDTSKGKLKNDTIADHDGNELRHLRLRNAPVRLDSNWHISDSSSYWDFSHTDYLWMYLVFAYLFTGLAAYMIVSETRRVIEIRQEYLGSQTTVTDRTIRLSGIPPELRSETKIKEFVEELEIGRVESVTLCRNWKALDDLMDKRMWTLRKLEEAWTVHLGHRRVERNLESLPVAQPSPPGPYADDSERSHLLGNGRVNSRRPTPPYNRSRPLVKLWYGRFRVWHRNVDAINFYEEKLRRLDEEINALRQKEFDPTPLAFVTMDSVSSCQMAVQAVLDPSPLQLLANTSPAPSDVVWNNTYMPRRERMLRAWSITVLIGFLTVLWTLILVPIAGFLSIDSIDRVFPGFKEAVDNHKNIKSLIVTQLPTLLVSLLNIAVPYLYDWLANHQGMIGQGDVELSVISKNFFFVFFNFFVVFTILGTASGFWGLLESIGERLRDATKITNALALSLQGLLNFYTNFVILQGVGLFPFRLLEFGAVVLYPITMMGAKTPRGTSLPHCSSFPANPYRLRGTSSTSGVQLRILPSPDNPDFHHLHSVQCSSFVLDGPPGWPGLLRYWALCAQIPAPLRHGPSSTFNWPRLDHDLRPRHSRLDPLPAYNGRSIGLEESLLASRSPCPLDYGYPLVLAHLFVFL